MMVALDMWVVFMFKMNQCPCCRVKAIESRIMTSPIRLVRAVISPAPSLLGFWK